MGNISITDSNSIRDLKNLENKERELINTIINRDSSSTDELLSCVSCLNLIHISYEYHEESNSTIGYKIGINAAQTLGRLYETLLSIRHSVIKEEDKVSSTNQLGDISDELKKVTLIIDDIIQEISKLLTCDEFIHSVDVTYDNEKSEVFIKKLSLKRHSSLIPNPHQIPTAYKLITGGDQKLIYRIYSNFTSYFACNWVIVIKRLGKIKKAFNTLHNLCPLIRLSMIKDILQENEINDLPSDITKSLVAIDAKSLIYFHSSYITSIIHNAKYHNATNDLLLEELKKIAQKLMDPMKDVIHLNIVMEATIKVMMIMSDLQGQNSLNLVQKKTLDTLEKFFVEMSKQISVTMKEMLSISYKISEKLIEEIKNEKQSVVESYRAL